MGNHMNISVNYNTQEDTTQKTKLWDPNVKVYNVFNENNEHISTLCLDPFLRSRKINHIWSYTGRGTY